MGERLDRLPKWARITIKSLGIVAPLCGAVSAIAITYFDVRDRATEADRKSEAGYETLAPAVAELQDLLEDSQRRIVRLETYIEIMSKGGLVSIALDDDDGDEDGDEGTEDAKPSEAKSTDDVAGYIPLPAPKEPPVKKAKRPVPQQIDKAQMYQQQRVQMHCSKEDPLCGL